MTRLKTCSYLGLASSFLLVGKIIRSFTAPVGCHACVAGRARPPRIQGRRAGSRPCDPCRCRVCQMANKRSLDPFYVNSLDSARCISVAGVRAQADGGGGGHVWNYWGCGADACVAAGVIIGWRGAGRNRTVLDECTYPSETETAREGSKVVGAIKPGSLSNTVLYNFLSSWSSFPGRSPKASHRNQTPPAAAKLSQTPAAAARQSSTAATNHTRYATLSRFEKLPPARPKQLVHSGTCPAKTAVRFDAIAGPAGSLLSLLGRLFLLADRYAPCSNDEKICARTRVTGSAVPASEMSRQPPVPRPSPKRPGSAARESQRGALWIAASVSDTRTGAPRHQVALERNLPRTRPDRFGFDGELTHLGIQHCLRATPACARMLCSCPRDFSIKLSSTRLRLDREIAGTYRCFE
jgi:hypothetical protein